MILLGFVALLLLILVVQTPLGKQLFFLALFGVMLAALVAALWIGHLWFHPPA